MTETTAETQILDDGMDPARAQALQATLSLDPVIGTGDALPPFFHHVYFWDPQPPERLGRDGHPKTGGFVPDMGLPRRMWAAGRLVFHAPLRAGIAARKTARIDQITRKTGRSGPLAFVRIRHDIHQRDALVLTEWQDLVYRADGGPTPERPRARTDETARAEVTFDPTVLFRYSALTFNGHRIHYDAPYAQQVEGYPGLVVHGPLLAQHLMLFGAAQLGQPLREVSYRATAPLCLPATGTLCWHDGRAWLRDPEGAQCMEAVFT